MTWKNGYLGSGPMQWVILVVVRMACLTVGCAMSFQQRIATARAGLCILIGRSFSQRLHQLCLKSRTMNGRNERRKELLQLVDEELEARPWKDSSRMVKCHSSSVSAPVALPLPALPLAL